MDPRDPDHLHVAVSSAGVLESTDGGQSWAGRNRGMLTDYLPNPEAEWGHDPHFVTHCPGQPDHFKLSADLLRAFWLTLNWLRAMPTIEMTSHLYRFFPHLKNRTLTAPPGPVAEILHTINDQAPGFTDYILDEHGALRRHVKLCINDTLVIDRKGLSDKVQDGDTLFIFQALSGG